MYGSLFIRISIVVLLLMSLWACQASSTPESETTQKVNSTPEVIFQGESDGAELLQPIEIDNCDGKGDVLRTEERSQSIEVTISAEIAAKLGASVEVISTEVQTAVGIARSHGAQRSTSIQLTTPPGTRMYYQLLWIGNEQVGIVQNLRGSNIPIVFQSFTPNDVRIKSQDDIGCPGSSEPKPVVTQQEPVIENTPTSQPVVRPDTFEVQADVMKNPTGIFVNKGDMLHFEYLSGQWTGDKSYPELNSGCGFTYHDPDDNHVWPLPPEQRGAALIGYIDSQPFWIGCSPINITADTSGELYLGMSDCQGCFWDNVGMLKVKVTVNGG